MNFHERERDILEKELEPLIEEMGFILVEALVIRRKKEVSIKITIYSEEGVTIDDCVKVSSAIKNQVDLEDKYGEDYSVEVASPGIGRKLKRLREYKIFEGKPVKIYLKEKAFGKKSFTGTIKKVEQNKIFIETDSNKELSFEIENISKGKINEKIQFN